MLKSTQTVNDNTSVTPQISSYNEPSKIKSAEAHLHRSFGLDFLRTAAILLVLVSHFGHQNFDVLGFWGVELFFALSGFLIGQILWKSYSSANKWTGALIFNFWLRRWWRTLPNYYLFLAIMLVTIFFSHDQMPSLSSLLKFVWFGQFLFSHNWGFYNISWSLCIEEWFYLLFPLVLFVFSKIIKSTKGSFVATLLFFFIGSIIIRKILIIHEPANYLRGITLARLDAIGYGVLVAYITSIFQINNVQKYAGFIVGFILQVLTAITLYFSGLEYIVKSQVFLILVPLGFALIIPLMSTVKMPEKGFSFFINVVEKLSLWSYSIYLSHVPFMWLMYFLLNNYRESFVGNFLSKLLGFLLTIVVSALLFKYFEFPLTKKRPAQMKV